MRDKNLSRDLFMREYNRPSDYDTFFDFCDHQMKKISHRTEMSTLGTHRSVINKLKEYNANLTMDDINRDWLDGYFSYLRRELENNANTAYKNMAIIKKYVLAAVKAGYMVENPFEDWSIKKGTASCVYLTEQELNKLTALYNSGELEYNYHKTLEFFLFMCFSSLHVGDARKLKLEQFSESHFVYYRIKLKNRKPEPIQIPISEPLEQLLHNITGTRKKGQIGRAHV